MISFQPRKSRSIRNIGVLICLIAQASIILLGCKDPAIPVVLISYVALCLIKLDKMIGEAGASVKELSQ